MSEETNRSLSALAIVTALFLPPTLVTGIFGINTTALPFSDSHYGSLWAIGLAAVAAGLVFGY